MTRVAGYDLAVLEAVVQHAQQLDEFLYGFTPLKLGGWCTKTHRLRVFRKLIVDSVDERVVIEFLSKHTVSALHHRGATHCFAVRLPAQGELNAWLPHDAIKRHKCSARTQVRNCWNIIATRLHFYKMFKSQHARSCQLNSLAIWRPPVQVSCKCTCKDATKIVTRWCHVRRTWAWFLLISSIYDDDMPL